MGDFPVHRVRFFEYTPQAIQCMAYQPDTQKMALSRADGSLEVWNIQDTWYQEEVIGGHEGRSIEAIVWQGDRLYTAGLDGYVNEIDLIKLQAKRKCPSNAGPVWCMTSNTACTQLATGTEDGCVVLFSTENDSLEYLRPFDKQEGRILCLSWHVGGETLVTGGIDNIRLWSVKSGRAVQRLTLGRQHQQQETIVWCVTILRDFTVVSGDSRGKTSFWNGKQGTLIRHFQAHKADVYCLSVDEAETSIVSSGVDSTLVKFDFTSARESSDWKTWVGSALHNQHSHDVRAVQVIGDAVVSGGVDAVMILTYLKTKQNVNTWRRIAPIPHRPRVKTARGAGIILLQYTDTLEVWRLGHSATSTARPGTDGETLKLRSNPVKLIELTSKHREPVTCCDITHDATLMAYSDCDSVRIYKINIDKLDSIQPNVSMKRLAAGAGDPPEGARCMCFTKDSQRLVTVTTACSLQVISLHSGSIQVEHTFPPLPGVPHLLAVSQCGGLAAVADHGGHVQVYSLQDLQPVCSLPQHSHQASALTFSSDSSMLAVCYTDQMIKEFSLEQQEYTSWYKEKGRQLPRFWLRRSSKVSHMFYQPRDNNRLILQDEQMFCILDKTQRFPQKNDRWSEGIKQDPDNPHAFHICSRYKFLMHLDILNDDSLVAVERTPYTLYSLLPDSLKQKKFGV